MYFQHLPSKTKNTQELQDFCLTVQYQNDLFLSAVDAPIIITNDLGQP